MQMILRIFRQALLLGYIFLTICALCYTLGRKQIPGVKWPFVTHFYAMMAPFQNYTTQNAELVVEGYSGNTWQKIDLTQYLPHGRGEIAIRTRMSSFGDKKSVYKQMAHELYDLEKGQGRTYSHIRIVWEKWPKSQYGFYGNHNDEDVTRNTVTTVTTP